MPNFVQKIIGAASSMLLFLVGLLALLAIFKASDIDPLNLSWSDLRAESVLLAFALILYGIAFVFGNSLRDPSRFRILFTSSAFLAIAAIILELSQVLQPRNALTTMIYYLPLAHYSTYFYASRIFKSKTGKEPYITGKADYTGAQITENNFRNDRRVTQDDYVFTMAVYFLPFIVLLLLWLISGIFAHPRV